MNKCWFVLQQSFYTPPEYASPSKARGKTVTGDLRLGDIVPSPANIYPILTQGALPLFSPDMRISSTQLCEFVWDTTSERENGGTIGGGVPIAAAAGAVVNAEISAEFKKTVTNWANFSKVDIEVVQPSRSYIEEVLALPDVKDYVEGNKFPLPFLNKWTVFVVTGLMIARTGGTIGSSQTTTHGFSGGPDVDVPGVVNAKLQGSHKRSIENNKSAEIKGDRVWAVRFAKVHKGLLRRRWMQTEETAGAALDGDYEEESVREVLNYEGLKDAKIADITVTGGEGNGWVFVTGEF
ncbi:hypothetical protein EV127DRAFT_464313 [Xylaria flabelliformis]|nr:hypothetical protein EV127DRAFT_464313 [Xylaria flabelliformis]